MTTWTRIRRWAFTRLVLEAAAIIGTIVVASRARLVPAEPSALQIPLDDSPLPAGIKADLERAAP
jgi:hypothetical protein